MPTKITEEQKEQVRLWIEEWAVRLRLDRYPIDIKFYKRKDPKSVGGETVYADVGHHYAGMDIDVNIWLPFWGLSDCQKERVCVHELVHVLLPSASERDICAATEIIWCLIKGEVISADTP
jgi:hypothetical protein